MHVYSTIYCVIYIDGYLLVSYDYLVFVLCQLYYTILYDYLMMAWWHPRAFALFHYISSYIIHNGMFLLPLPRPLAGTSLFLDPRSHTYPVLASGGTPCLLLAASHACFWRHFLAVSDSIPCLLLAALPFLRLYMYSSAILGSDLKVGLAHAYITTLT